MWDSHVEKKVEEVTVGDAIIAMQIVDRLASVGGIKGPELQVIANLRTKMVGVVETATGLNYDVEVARAQAQAQSQQAQVPQPEETKKTSPARRKK